MTSLYFCHKNKGCGAEDETAGSEENSLCCLIQYIDRLVQNAVWIQKVTEKMPKVYLPLKLLPVISKAWCSMTATHTGEVCREIDRKILGKYQTLQKFWSAHIQSNLIILFLGAIVFTDEQNSSSSWQTPQQYAATVQHDTDPFMANWGNRTEVLQGHSLMTQNKNCDAWIMFTYCYLYVVFPGKKALKEHQDDSLCLYIAWLLQKLFLQDGAFFLHPRYFHEYTKLTVFDILV